MPPTGRSSSSTQAPATTSERYLVSGVRLDRVVELMEDWPGHQQVLRGPEGLLQGPKLLVAEHGFERVELGVGAQHEHAVELGVLLGLWRDRWQNGRCRWS
jgi:hypothetical protein